jgi:hypothetical protein
MAQVMECLPSNWRPWVQISMPQNKQTKKCCSKTHTKWQLPLESMSLDSTAWVPCAALITGILWTPGPQRGLLVPVIPATVPRYGTWLPYHSASSTKVSRSHRSCLPGGSSPALDIWPSTLQALSKYLTKKWIDGQSLLTPQTSIWEHLTPPLGEPQLGSGKS